MSGFRYALKKWYSTLEGRSILAQEKTLVSHAIENLFGYFLVQLGVPCNEDLIQKSRIKNKVLLDADLNQLVAKNAKQPHEHFINADLTYLPIGKESADVVFLPHTLESAEDPYYLLRQVDAMLVPEGHVVITGFNPMGCLIMRHRWFKAGRLFQQAKLERSHRIVEWLEVLGYEVQTPQYSRVTCFTQRTQQTRFIRLLEWLETRLISMGFQFGNVYCLVAKKRVDSPRLVGSRWQIPKWVSAPARGTISTARVDNRRLELADKTQNSDAKQ